MAEPTADPKLELDEMANGLDFNEATARALEHLYRAPEVALQRALVLHSMSLRAGEVVLDVGPGPGFLATNMAAIVGPSGVVSGIDQSEPMVAMARALQRAGLGGHPGRTGD